MKIPLRIREKIPPQTRSKAPPRPFLIKVQALLKIPQQILRLPPHMLATKFLKIAPQVRIPATSAIAKLKIPHRVTMIAQDLLQARTLRRTQALKAQATLKNPR